MLMDVTTQERRNADPDSARDQRAMDVFETWVLILTLGTETAVLPTDRLAFALQPGTVPPPLVGRDHFSRPDANLLFLGFGFSVQVHRP